MSEYDKLNQLTEFKPFYNKDTTQRMLSAYQQAPHLFREDIVNQLKNHAVHYKMDIPEPPVNTPKNDNFNLLRGIRGIGEGFLSGFTTFNVGEPSNNPYERIMRSVGQLGGFVGYLPTAPGKILKSQTLIDMATSLRGKSVPLWVAKKTTEKVAPIVSSTLEKAATAKNSAFRDAAKFLIGEKSKHVAEGAFNLGIANTVSTWQLGVNEMLKAGLHGAVTGGAFRGIANLVNKGGIPKLDQETGKMVYTASQTEDRIIRSAASSLYEGLQSSYRGETTPEQIYSYLLGAYFGAHETTAGQMSAMKFVNKVEKQAVVNAKELKRLDKDGKPYQWDQKVYDPTLVDGWDKLTPDVQESVMHTIALRHGTFAKQAAMAGETVEGIKEAIDTDVGFESAVRQVRETQIAEKAAEYSTDIIPVDNINPKYISANKDKAVIQVTKVGDVLTRDKEGRLTVKDPIKRDDNVIELPLEGMTDENLGMNRKIIKDALEQIPKGKEIAVQTDIYNVLEKNAPETLNFLQNRFGDIATGREQARKESGIDSKDIELDSYDTDISSSPDVLIKKQARHFVSKFMPKLNEGLTNPEEIGARKIQAEKDIYTILNRYNNIGSFKKFVGSIEKKFPDQPKFAEDAMGELRQMFIRKVEQRPSPHFSLEFDNYGRLVNLTTLVGKNGENRAGNPKNTGDSIKQIEIVAEKYYDYNPNDRVYMVLDHAVGWFGRKNRPQEIELKKLSDKGNFRGKAGQFPKEAEKRAEQLISQALRAADEKGYYYSGGKGDSGKMYFLKYHPELLNIKNYKTHADQIVKVFEKNGHKNVAKHYKKLREDFVKRRQYQGPARAGEYFDKSFISNLLWEKDLYGLTDMDNYVDWISKTKNGRLINSQIPDAKGYNKRSQIWYTDGFAVDSKYFKEIYKDLGDATPLKGNDVKFRIFKETAEKDLTSDDKAVLYGESTDGSILVEESFVDALNKTYGLPKSGQNKSFIVSPNSKDGALLGKFMFHRASPKASKYMREKKIHMLMPESAAKEYGSRVPGDLVVNPDGSVNPWNSKTYTMKLSDIKGSLSEKQSDHMLKPQLIPKQLMSNLHRHSFKNIKQETIDEFFNEVIGERYIGEDLFNTKLENALKSKDIDAATQSEILDNIDKIGLSQLVDAVKDVNHPNFVGRLYQKALRSNVDNLTQDFESGDITRAEYADAVAEAKVFTSNINRMMEIYPDLSIFLHKDVRNYLQAAMRNFIVNKVTRPKWENSITTRMRGYDPWLVNEFPEMNFNTSGKGSRANKKILKEKFGVENPDQLFYLDNEYKKIEYNVSDLVTTGKKKMTLEELWDKHRDDPKVKEFFKTISLRIPMDSISGAHELAFAGFTGIDGHGAVFHPRTMRALGGADLDGDKAFVFFGMKKEYRDMYHQNKYEYRDPKTKIIEDNKGASISKQGMKILSETLDPNDPHNKIVLDKIKKGKVTMQDLLTTTNDGSKGDLELKNSILGKYTTESRLNIADNAVKGRDQLGPAVSSKQILNSTYDALRNHPVQRYVRKKGGYIKTVEEYDALPEKAKKNYVPDYREEIVFSPEWGSKKIYKIYVTPRDDVSYSRELTRAQIGFGSDPLDEIGLSGQGHFFDTAWHSLFKIDWGRTPKSIREKFSPNSHARQGVFQIMKDFNAAYFSRNWDKGRRFYAHEIMNMSQGIHRLSEKQRSTMLPKMVEMLEPLDYTDDVLRRVDPELLQRRYDKFNNEDAKELLAINDAFNVEGGLLGRKSFKSISNDMTYKVIDNKLWAPKRRKEIAEDKALYEEFFRGFKTGRFSHDNFMRNSFPWEYQNKFENVDQLENAIANAEKYRYDAVDAAYRQGTDFAQNDAMDRASAVRLLEAIKLAKADGVNDNFINTMGKFVNNIKTIEYEQGKQNLRSDVLQSKIIGKISPEGRKYMEEVFQVDPTLKPFAIQEDIDTRIRNFKLNNGYKKSQGVKGVYNSKTKQMEYPLSEAESYLLDTMMLSSYYRGDNLTQLAAYKKLPWKVRQFLEAPLNELHRGSAGTYFRKTGLNSKYVNDRAIRDFLKQYAAEFDGELTALKDFDTEAAVDKTEKRGSAKEIAPDNPFESDEAGVMNIRKRYEEAGKVKLSDPERKMVDELIGHVKHYHNSIGTLKQLNLIARGLRNKNLDAYTIEDYRVLNNYFQDMRTGNMFIKPGKLTQDGIVKLAKRHWMLFPKQVSEEMMVKDFDIFEQQGFFQNFKGEMVAGKQGMPTHTIEAIQYVLGRSEALAVKMNEDEKVNFEKELRTRTGYESVEGGIGNQIAEVVTAERDLRSFRSKSKGMSNGEKFSKLKYYEDNLKKAKEVANWDAIKGKEFSVKRPGGTFTKTGRQLANEINDVLTDQSIRAMKWIRGSHYTWNSKLQEYIRNPKKEDPIMPFVIGYDKGKPEYWAGNPTLPKIDARKFTNHLLKQLQSGEPMKMELGLDNLRKISRSIQIDKLISQAKGTRGEVRDMYDTLIQKLSLQKLDQTNYFKPTDYHPHFIHDKSIARKSVIDQINKIKKLTSKGPEWQSQEIKKLLGQYKSMTGDWLNADIIEDQIITGALQEIVDGRKGEHFKHLEKNPIAANMMSRSNDLPGWSRDLGSWDIYQKNLIDTYFRQIGNIMSKKMLQSFNEKVSVEWKDQDQVMAWDNYISDYISRALGFPSKLPENWMSGKEADLMNVKGTPYSWFADNHVKDMVNRIRKKIGLKDDNRLPEELRGIDEMDLRHWSNLEAKYQMATLLAHPKSSAANIFGGTIHTIQSAGWRNWRNGRSVEHFRTHVANEASEWTSKKDIDKWVIGHGVVPDFILYEAGLNPNFRSGKWKNFLDDAKKVLEKDESVKDETLVSIAKKHKITESAFYKAAWFMREPERMLRRDAFAAHYLQARELFGHANMPLDHPLLIEMAKKGVQATQFLYSAPFRPAFSATSLGKVMTRFQTWAWNSVRFRNDVYKKAKIYGFRRGTPEFDRFKRQYLTDMFVFGLGNVFAYSLFESAMPAPWNWFQDTADWIFGDEKERDRAFFGQWPTAIAPLQMVTPPGLRLVPATFSGLVNDDFSRLSNYYMWTMFPFGRMARDAKGILENPMRTIEKTTGLPYQAFAREATKYKVEDETE